jgi:hypothetical protein
MVENDESLIGCHGYVYVQTTVKSYNTYQKRECILQTTWLVEASDSFASHETPGVWSCLPYILYSIFLYDVKMGILVALKLLWGLDGRYEKLSKAASHASRRHFPIHLEKKAFSLVVPVRKAGADAGVGRLMDLLDFKHFHSG